jgi:hypothetical protein
MEDGMWWECCCSVGSLEVESNLLDYYSWLVEAEATAVSADHGGGGNYSPAETEAGFANS